MTMFSSDYTACGKWEGLTPVNRFNYASWIAVIFPTGCPKSVPNSRVNKSFCLRFCVVTWLFEFSVGI